MEILDCSGEFITKHIDRFVELYNQIFYLCHPAKYSSSDKLRREQIEKKIAYVNQGAGKVFCSVSDGVITGFIHIYIQPFLDEKRLVVADFVVDDGLRRQGIGTKLIQRAEEYAKAEGCATVSLMAVNTENALRFYRASGYADSRVEMLKKLN